MTSQEWRDHLSRMWFGGSGVPKDGKLDHLLQDMHRLELELVIERAYASCLGKLIDELKKLPQ